MKFHTGTEVITELLIQVNCCLTLSLRPSVSSMAKRRSLSKSSVTSASDISDNQLKVLNNSFQSNQFVSHNEAEQISKDIRMPIAKIKAWFINMRRKAKRHSLKDLSSDDIDGVTLQEQYPNVKLPSVDVLMDLKTINAMKNSLESIEIVIDDEDEAQIKDDAPFDEKDVSDLDTPTLLGINTTLKDLMQNNQEMFVDDDTPLIKECTTKNQYVEILLQKIEYLEDAIKEKEGKVYFAEKELHETQDKLNRTEIVLNTVQESIPKVVSDHKKALLEKDAEILKWKAQAEEVTKASKNNEENLRDNNTRLEEEINELKDNIKKRNLDQEKDPNEESEKLKVQINQLQSELKNKDDDLEVMRSKLLHTEKDEPERDIKEEAEKKFKVHITQLQNELKQKDDDFKIMRFKVRQAEQNEKMRIELEETGKKLGIEVEKLRQSVEIETQKRADLELDVFSKSVEIKSMAQTISTLNEKLQNLKKD